jgi:N-formylglutamate amidohydrolase
MERTSFIQGTSPIVIVAPHGYDDENTAQISELVARDLGAFAVINRGWRKSKKIDQMKDLANCNDIRHIHEEVVKEEFLNPILRSVARIKSKNNGKALMILVHGCRDEVRTRAEDEMMDMIVGYGAGNPVSYSCRLKTKNVLIHCLREEGFGVYEGASGSKYAGWAKNNLNQFFTRWIPDHHVESVQLEIVHEMRCDRSMVSMTSEGIVSALDMFMIKVNEEFDEESEIKQI